MTVQADTSAVSGVDAPAPPRKRYPKRGFGSMSKDKVKEIASKGGRAAHEQGTGHEWDSHEARMAGRKGGVRSGASRREVARQQERLAEGGRT